MNSKTAKTTATLTFAVIAASLALSVSSEAAPQHAERPTASRAPSGYHSGRLDVIVDGPAQPIGDIILIPGLTSSPAVWDRLTEQLKDRYRVHRVHIAGFAGRPAGANATGLVCAPVAEEIARYIRETGLDAPAVIGHSMGGSIAMMLASRHPESVSRLMVVDVIPFVGSMFGGPTATAESLGPIADQMYAGMANSPSEQWAAQSAASIVGMVNTLSERAGPTRDSATSDPKVAAAAFRELIVTDLRPELAQITAPTKVVYVKFNDPTMTPEITDTIYQAAFATLPSVELIRIDESAHFVMLDQHARFGAEVMDFLE